MKYLIALILVSFLSPNIVFGDNHDQEIIQMIFDNELHERESEDAYKEIKAINKNIDEQHFNSLFDSVLFVSNNESLFLYPKNRKLIKTVLKEGLYKRNNVNKPLKRYMQAGLISNLAKKFIDFINKHPNTIKYIKYILWYLFSNSNESDNLRLVKTSNGDIIIQTATTENIDDQKKQ